MTARNWKRLVWVLWALIMLWLLAGVVSALRAGEVKLTWTGEADGYKVYIGTNSGVYQPGIDVGDVQMYTADTLVDGCVTHYFAVTGYNAIGESDYSDEVTAIPRPLVASVLMSGPNEWKIMGGNFGPGLTMTINNVPTIFTRIGCEELRMPVVEIPGDPGQNFATMQLCNGPVCLSYNIYRPAKPTDLTAQ